MEETSLSDTRQTFSSLPLWTPPAPTLGIALGPLMPEHLGDLTTRPCGLFYQMAPDQLACEKVLTTSASSTSISHSWTSGAGMEHWLRCLFDILWVCVTGRVAPYLWVWWADDAEQLMRCRCYRSG